MKISRMFGGSGVDGDGKEVARLKEAGDFVGAGRLLEEQGRLAAAADAYLQGKELRAAAHVLERLGRHAKAGELYLRVGEARKGGALLALAGNADRAAEIFLEQGNTLEAARLYGVAGAWSKAGDLYARGGYPLRAAEAYKKHGDLARSAACYEQHFVENVSYGSTQLASADQKAALLAGQLYEKVGDRERALAIYGRGGFHLEAAGAAAALGRWEQAAELYTRGEALERAAEAWEQAGEREKSALLRGEVAFKADRMSEAAHCFEQGRDFYRAAELYESLGMLAEAASAYDSGGAYAEAGSVHLRAGDKRHAAASYEMAGQFETAARLFQEDGEVDKAAALFEKAGMTFMSGEAAARAGDRERAIALLQRVEPEDERFAAATELLAKLFLEVDMPGLAVERLRLVLESRPVSPATIGLYYWLAVCTEAAGDRGAARALYDKILAIDFSHRDVAERARKIDSTAEEAGLAELEVVEQLPEPAPRVDPAARPGGPRFRIEEEIGSGALGPVQRAVDTSDGRSVALRLLSTGGMGSDLLGALVSDLVAASRLSHPNLVRVLGVVDLDGRTGVVSELVRGTSLADAIRSGQRMSVRQCHKLGVTLAQVLAFVHERGLCHGSIRPSNVMLPEGVAKLADLGLGRLHRASTGPDGYRSPEGQLDVAGDIYALGALLYHVLTGVEPKLRTPGAVVRKPSQLAPGVPERFDQLLLRCLEPRPVERFGAATEVLATLDSMVTIG